MQNYREKTAFISLFQHSNAFLINEREILASVLNFEQVIEKNRLNFFWISKFNVSVFANRLNPWTSVSGFVAFDDLLFWIKIILLFMKKNLALMLFFRQIRNVCCSLLWFFCLFRLLSFSYQLFHLSFFIEKNKKLIFFRKILFLAIPPLIFPNDIGQYSI